MKVLVQSEDTVSKIVDVADDSNLQANALRAVGLAQEDIDFLLTHSWVERTVSKDGLTTRYVSDSADVLVTKLPE